MNKGDLYVSDLGTPYLTPRISGAGSEKFKEKELPKFTRALDADNI
jgi:hypothetical protein